MWVVIRLWHKEHQLNHNGRPGQWNGLVWDTITVAASIALTDRRFRKDVGAPGSDYLRLYRKRG